MALGQAELLVESLADRADRAIADHGQLRAHIHAGHKAVGRSAGFLHALIGKANAGLFLPESSGALTGVPGQICTRPVAISCEADPLVELADRQAPGRRAC
jgi:hypothetical protein